MQDGLEVKLPGSETAKAGARALWNVATGNWRTPAKITIQINFSTVAANWQLEVSPTNTIANVKQKIFEQHHLPAYDQQLSIGHPDPVEFINDTDTLQQCGIKNNDILHLKLKDHDRPITIYIQYRSGERVSVGVMNHDTLDEVRARIFDQDVVLHDKDSAVLNYKLTVAENNLKNDDVLYAQDEKVKVDIPKPMRLKTPPSAQKERSDRQRKSGEHEIERESESSEDETDKLRVLDAALKGDGPRAASGAREKSADKHGLEEEVKSQMSSKSRRTVYSQAEEEVARLEAKLQEKRDQIEEERKFIRGLCSKLGLVVKSDSFHSDIATKIDEIQGKLTKRDTLIGGLKKMFEGEEILPAVEDDGHLVASIKELKDFSVEIGRLLKVTGDVDLTAYKNKTREIMEHETRQRATITQLESEVAHFKAVVQEKEANISDLQAANTSLKSMENMSEDSLKKSAQEAEAKALTYQQQIRQYERVTSEQQDKVDKLGTELDEVKSQLQLVTSQSAAKLLQFTDKVARRVKQIEAEKQALIQQLNEADTEAYALENKHKELKQQYTALEHQNTTNERHLKAAEQKFYTQANEIKIANHKLQEIGDQLSTAKKTIQTHEQTIATINTKLQTSDQEITKLQGFIRDHEKHATTTAAQLKRLEGIEKQFNASLAGEDAKLQLANDQIKQKDGEIHKITAELASTKSELSKLSTEIDKVLELNKTQRLLIDNLTREKQDAEYSVTLLKKQVRKVSSPQQIVSTPENSESRQAIGYYNRIFQGGSGGGGGGGGGDDPHQSYHQYAPHDTDGRGDQASVHFAHLLARLRELLGEDPSIALVDDLVGVFENHITTNTARQALLRRIRPESATSRYPMTFHEYLYDYLLEHTSKTMSIHDQLRKLHEEGSQNGIDV
jgi:hypothetical protein